VLVDALLVAGPARVRLASDKLQAPELIDAELLSVLRRLVLAEQLDAPLLTGDAASPGHREYVAPWRCWSRDQT
jgi:hypothetical protein